MLKNLSIKNYVLIRSLDMEPSAHLNIITGETGAGKSIMLGAVGLLLGNRADTKTLFDQKEKCIIEGTFDISEYKLKKIFEEEELDYEDICIIRREISPLNKSRAFINDTPVNLEVLKKVGHRLMDVHSQHETLLLGDNDFQAEIVDAYAGNGELLSAYKALFYKHKDLQQKLNELTKISEEEKKQLDYNTYQLNELTEANLIQGEQEKLEEEMKRTENSEQIKSRLNEAVQLLTSSDNPVIANLQTIQKILDFLAPFSPEYEKLKVRLASCLIEVKDISDELENEDATIEFGKDNLETIQERLDKIYTLQKKHRVVTIEELIGIRNDLEKKVNEVMSLDDEIIQTKSNLDLVYKELIGKGDGLSKSRTAVLEKIKAELKSLLKEVGIPDATITMGIEPIAPSKNGTDAISLLFSANKGVAPQELKNAASGGEFSRLMLCIKYILASKTSLPTIVFDEIDTGISGEIAIKVGKMMKQMAKSHQVVAISHLPQMAAQGDTHYFVYKDNSSERAVSRIKRLSSEERIKEIAQMIGGEKPSETAILSAKELLSIH